MDTVARLQWDLNDMRVLISLNAGSSGYFAEAQAGDILRRQRYRSLRRPLAGNNTGRCLMPLCFQMDGTQLLSHLAGDALNVALL